MNLAHFDFPEHRGLSSPWRAPDLSPWKTPAAWRILYVIDEKEARVTVLQIRHERRRLLPDTEL